MFSKFSKLMRAGKRTTLTTDEKLQQRGALLAYMQDHPVRNPAAHRQVGMKRGFTSYYLLRPMPLALILVLVAGVGTSAAAETALPGDALYSVKTEINEPVRGALTLSAEGRTAWEERLAERRLEEAAALEAKGRLDAQVREQLTARFEEHAQHVEDRIKLLQTISGDDEKAAELAARLEASLHAHEAVLSRMHDESGELQRVVDTVENRATQATELREKIETVIERHAESSTSTPEDADRSKEAAHARMDAAEHALDETKNFIEDKQVHTRADADAIARATARLKDAQDMFVTGKAQFEAGAYSRAFLDFQDVYRMCNDIRVSLNTDRADVQHEEENEDTTTSSPRLEVREHGSVRLELGR